MFAQSGNVAVDQVSKTEVFNIAEEMPEFPGGPKAMMLFIQKTLNYPLQAKEKGFQGKVFLKFIVNNDGAIDSVFVLKSSGYRILDNEAIRVIKVMPKWKPGFQNGKPVPVYFNLPISFNLVEESKGTDYYNAGLKFFKDGKFVDAKENYKKAYKLNYKDQDALYNLGVTYYKLNQKDSACYCWNEMKDKFQSKDAEELIKKYCSN